MVTYYISPRRAMAQRMRSDAQRPAVHIPVDVAVNGENYLISAFVPGVSAEDLEIEILEDVISIKGEFPTIEDVEDAEDIKYLRRERPSGSFARTLRLPTVLNAGKAEAEVVNGILELRVPIAEEAKAKQIKVKTK